MSERMKANNYNQTFVNSYFWRTYSGAELDLVEEKGGQLNGFEFKWANSQVKPPASWLENYSESTFQCINTTNFLDWLKNKDMY